MPFIRKRNDLKINETELERLENLIKSRIEAHSKVVRANILLGYARGEAIHAIARELRVRRPLVERCVDKALSGGIEVALTDLRRKGRPPLITVEDKTWVINLACKKPKDLGYSYERWTISLLAKHVKKNAAEEGHSSLSSAGESLIRGI